MGEHTKKKQAILAAARLRFAHYGFNKTTMAEIAGDCQMSAANIYRYFSGKKELLAQIAQFFFREVEDDIEKYILEPTLSPVEKIEGLTLISLNNSYEQYSDLPKINEAIDFINTERADLVVEHKRRKVAILIRILDEGVGTGFFAPHDTFLRAEALLNGTLFVHPIFLGMYDIEYLRKSLIQVVAMMTEGLVVHSIEKKGNKTMAMGVS